MVSLLHGYLRRFEAVVDSGGGRAGTFLDEAEPLPLLPVLAVSAFNKGIFQLYQKVPHNPSFYF